MNEEFEWLKHAVMIGVGATIVMDLWGVFLRYCFHISSLNYAMVGRWIGHIPRGRLMHDNIMQTSSVRGELMLGWIAHYVIGIFFAMALLTIVGPQWVEQPTLLLPLIFGILTVVFPFFVLQPGFGAGIAASKTLQPNVMRLRSLMNHTSFGIGLYLSAWVAKFVL